VINVNFKLQHRQTSFAESDNYFARAV